MKKFALAVTALFAATLLTAAPAMADPTPSVSPSPSPSPVTSPVPVMSPAATPALPAVPAPANASQCSFGNNFYMFVSDWAYYGNGITSYFNGQIVGSDGVLKLNINNDGTFFCQLVVPGLQGSEWLDMNGSNLCMTLNWNAQDVDVITCRGLPSQGWQLYDRLPNNALGIDFGGMYNDYTNHGTQWLAMNSVQQSTPDQFFCCWNGSSIYGFTLDHF